jgi:hypothetical protein
MRIDHYLRQCRERFYSNRFRKDVHAEVNLMPAQQSLQAGQTSKQFRELMTTLHERTESIYILKVAIDLASPESNFLTGSSILKSYRRKQKQHRRRNIINKIWHFLRGLT